MCNDCGTVCVSVQQLLEMYWSSVTTVEHSLRDEFYGCWIWFLSVEHLLSKGLICYTNVEHGVYLCPLGPIRGLRGVP